MTPQSVETLMTELESEDRLDFGELAIGEDEARRLMADHFCEIDQRLAEVGLPLEARLEAMAAIAAHTMVENMILHLERLQAGGANPAFRAWLRRHGTP